MFKKENGRVNLARTEEEVLKFWEENKIFEKSIEQRKDAEPYSFYDGPPFATGLPHYGHILATAIKDSVTRFWAMNGRKVERRVGWDCHGLPVENLIEKELGLKDKKAIEEMGVEKFNDACRSAVFRSVNSFQKTLERVGRWADYSSSYATLDNPYMESVWWVFKQLWDKGLVYSAYRVTPYCPRCGTPLSNFETNQGYKDTEDPAIFVKFKVKGEENTYFVAWTTTPWTLTANVALAVNPEFDYVKVKNPKLTDDGGVIRNDKNEPIYEYLILAKDIYEKSLKDSNNSLMSIFGLAFETPENTPDVQSQSVKEYKGEDLLDMEYEPLFNFVKPEGKSHVVIPADFVTLDDGSGIVHTAGLFGVDDMEACRHNNIAMILTVDQAGKFIDAVEPWKGMFVKKGDPLIIENLKERGLLLKEDKIIHSYPFCWRCDTPLLYYPIDTWYVAVTKFKDQLLANNKEITWVPEHLKEGRFGKWLADARDWAISRNRFWGTPLPIFKCEDDHVTAVGSLDELALKAISSNNEYYIMRHGIAESNERNVSSCAPEQFINDLTERGVEEAEKTAEHFKQDGMDVIFTSPLLRTKRTAEIIAKATGAELKVDERLTEYNVGIFNNRPAQEFWSFIGEEINKFSKIPENGESLNSVRERMMDFLLSLEKEYKNKKIFIVSHGDPLWALEGAASGLNEQEIVGEYANAIQPGEWRKIELKNLPYDHQGRLDMHRPFIDSVAIKCETCGKEAKLTSHVFDCWFESGSMPYASWHYPFENKERVEKIFPADFIAEGLDQTRGWFYTLHVLATALTLNGGLGKNHSVPAFKNVIVNGLVLAEDGKKLSKKLRNYTEPELVFEKFGADALRYFLLSSTTIGDDYRFSDKGVSEIKTKVIDRLVNSLNFYEMYVKEDPDEKPKAARSILDEWIITRLDQTILEMTNRMEKYNLTEATRSLIDFLDDLSNWHIRRSRTRLQRPASDQDFYAAAQTLKFVILETSKLLAPFSPFISEAVYKTIGGKKESVHLEDWPKRKMEDISLEKAILVKNMLTVRELASEALARRSEAGIKVKQPLKSYQFNNQSLDGKEDLLAILEDEANVKKASHSGVAPEGGLLDIEIGTELKIEGIVREMTRMTQDLRQKGGLNPGDRTDLFLDIPQLVEGFIKGHESELKRALSVNNIEYKKIEDVRAFGEDESDLGPVWIGIK